MLNFKSIIAASLVALVLPMAASATIVSTYTDRASYVAAALHVLPLSLALPGAPPVFVSDFTSGGLTILGQDGGLAGDGVNIISTELDSDVLILNFSEAIFGVGLFGGVTDFDFAYIDGELSVEAVGSGTASLIANGGASYLGLLSDTGFTQLRLSVASFDTSVSTVGFASLQGNVDQATTVPEPAAWLMMVIGFGLLGSVQRSRSRVLAC